MTDNGCGVEPDHYQALTLKYHTSKLREFDDLANVGTFGFRGEALSSLCALSDVKIATAIAGQKVGTEVTYDNEGIISSTRPCAHGRGTTVTLENIFSKTPVRAQEIKRNIKKELGLMVKLIHGYCLVRPDVRITCTSIIGTKRNVLVNTPGRSTVDKVIASLYGHKQLPQLLPLAPTAAQVASDGKLSMTGYVSKATPEASRGSSDRQFFSINGRPCDYPKVTKAVNEVFRQFITGKCPFFVLDVILPREVVDVNITPDKRSVLTHHETELLGFVKSSLQTLWEPSRSSYMVGSCVSRTTQSKLPAQFKRFNHDAASFEDDVSEAVAANSGNGAPVPVFDSIQNTSAKVPQASSLKLAAFDAKGKKEAVARESLLDLTNGSGSTGSGKSGLKRPASQMIDQNDDVDDYIVTRSAKCSDGCMCCTEDDNGLLLHARERALTDAVDAPQMSELELSKLVYQSVRPAGATVEVNIEDIATAVAFRNTDSGHDVVSSTAANFTAKIGASSSIEAEVELARSIQKADFTKMDILGQFNLGFILTQLGNDIFIVDQHAADEKYNFERLQRETVMQSQMLFAPKILDLTAVHEEVVMDNLHIFKKNGFDFTFNMTAPPTKRVKMTKIPLSKGTVLGTSEVDELIFMLSDSPGTICRPSRLRSMFASRACRSSVISDICFCYYQLS